MQNKPVLIFLVVAAVLLVGGGALFIGLPNMSKPLLTASPVPATDVKASPSVGTPVATRSAIIPVGSRITSVLMSDAKQGTSVSESTLKTVFAPDTQTIYTTVLLTQDATETSVILKVVYNNDKSELGPVSSTVKSEDGEKFATFQMNKPKGGWPVGSYTATVVLPSGGNAEASFVVQ